MRYVLIVLIALSFVACKGKFIEESRGQSYTQTSEESCSKCGICSYYDYNKGKYRTGASCKCEGRRQVQYEITPVTGHYEKEPNVTLNEERRRRVKSGECK